MNPLYLDGFSYTDKCNSGDMIVHYIMEGSQGESSKL